MTISDRECVAFHEAGHAVAHVMLGTPFRYVTIRPRSDTAAGHVMCRKFRPIPPDDSAQYQLDPEDVEWATARSQQTGQLLPAPSARESHYDVGTSP